HRLDTIQIFLSRHPPPSEIFTLSLHDALPIFPPPRGRADGNEHHIRPGHGGGEVGGKAQPPGLHIFGHQRLEPRLEDRNVAGIRSEEHTSELQSRENLVCRLLLEKKKKMSKIR